MALNPPVALPYIFVNGTIIDARQVNADFAALIDAVNVESRNILMAPTTFYVAPFGADVAGAGLSVTSPAATMSYVLNQIVANFDLNYQTVTIQLANGAYVETLNHFGTIIGLHAANNLIVQGNLASPNLVTWTGDPCLNVANGALIRVQGVTMNSTGSSCIIAQTHARVLFGTVVFGNASDSHLLSARGCTIGANANYTIAGGGASHARASEAGEIYLDPGSLSGTQIGSPTVTLIGTPHFSNAFAVANALSLVKVGAVFSPPAGGATGPRWHATYNGVISVLGQAEPYLPGDAVGTTTTGGQYA